MRASFAAFVFSIVCGFVGADANAEVQYAKVVPEYRLRFPSDEGSHPTFAAEWWYLTGWLETQDGRSFGFQVTFFRHRPGTDEDNPSQFAAKQMLFAHAAFSDPSRGKLLRDERTARAGFGLAEATEGALHVHIDDWEMRRSGDTIRTTIAAENFAFTFDCVVSQAPLLQGRDGFSQKGPSPHAASYYYSLPQLRTRGTVQVDGRALEVSGVAWLDHEWLDREWFTAMLDEETTGWDWIGLNLDDGSAVMAQRVRSATASNGWAFGTWRDGKGDAQTFEPDAIAWSPRRRWRSPRTGIEYPIEWQVRIGERTIVLRPLLDDQESDARGSTGNIYWEGAVRAFDTQGRAIGKGYLELTGYGSRIR